MRTNREDSDDVAPTRESCLSILRRASTEPKAWFEKMFVFDELPYGHELPTVWIEAIEEASLWEDAGSGREYFYHACADALIRWKPESTSLPPLLARILRETPGWTSYRLVASFLRLRGWQMPETIKGATRDSFRRMSPVRRAILGFQPTIRKVLRTAGL